MATKREQLGSAPASSALWRDPRVRAIAFQVLTLLGVILFFGFIVNNTINNLERQGIASGFGFLDKPAGFGIPLTLIEYNELSPNSRVFWVGLLNTVLVAVIGIALATVLGFTIGLARLSANWLVARLATVYIEIVRNVPLLLQILFWYFAVLQALPHPRDSMVFDGLLYLNNRGLSMPRPIFLEGFGWVPLAALAGIVAALVIARWARRRREATGQPFPTVSMALGLILGLPLLAFLVTGVPLDFAHPEMGRFRLQGGMVLLPELVALALALSIYTAAFIAETVRAGILSVSHGQIEAAHALGLKHGQTLRFVVIPQALRVIIPPLTSQYLNLTKNSSLAVAIGYPDFVNVFTGIVLNQTGQAVEVIAMTMAVYLTLSLLTSAFMNWYNRRIALVER
ncbi:MAG TPA: amino acid ABC transporter permease [Geminicoccaceae bacterium]|nr:amino acid ABC transporter permease [Geminicoccaceae bacterium]